MALITRDDFIETYCKIRQRGVDFFLSKFTSNKQKRTKGAFNTAQINTSNWWDIPAVKRRWNKFISGDAHVNYREYLMQHYFKDVTDLKLLSLGSGSCSQELEFAEYSQFSEIVCVDIAETRLNEAAEIAKKKGLSSMQFLCEDVYQFDLPQAHYDLVLFNSSLHHFKGIEDLLINKINPSLVANGRVIINEYVGPDRLQFPRHQLKATARAIRSIPKKFRKRFRTQLTKSSYSGPGSLRMIIADPSECVESSAILPVLHRHYDIIIEKPFGGNLLMGALKDIAYNFVEMNSEKKAILQELFEMEDEYLKTNPSDYVFGMYQKKA